jgi:ABC-2 type transport system ATP-binding protein
MSADPLATTAVSAVGLTRRFGTRTALRDISLDIARGELFALIGPDGAGKTTFFRLVAGLLAPTSGTVTRHATETFGLVPQRFSLYEDLSIDENLSLRARLYGVPRDVERRRTTDLLARVGLERFRSRLAGALSGGMKQKLALVSALLTQPALLLLDEPTTGVDPVSRREFWRLLHQLHHEGLTLVVSTPYMDEAEYATRLAFLDNGRITAQGTRETLVASYPRALVDVQTAARAEARRRLADLAAVGDVSVFGTRLHVRAREGHDARLLPDVRAGLDGLVPPAAIQPIPASLEDVFVWHSENGDRDATANTVLPREVHS